eukprot:CCRYP_003092-RA/>CCRYP_003092-RA protein AED:0.03 eAED:0.03 QI:694/1/1/1/1/1/2/430/301
MMTEMTDGRGNTANMIVFRIASCIRIVRIGTRIKKRMESSRGGLNQRGIWSVRSGRGMRVGIIIITMVTMMAIRLSTTLDPIALPKVRCCCCHRRDVTPQALLFCLEHTTNFSSHHPAVYSGGEVYLGLYTDDSCTNFADTNSGRNTYKSLAGTDLPYAATSLISSDCVSCIEVEDLNRRQDEAQDDAYGDDAEDADEVSEQCERLYQSSGKCEMSLSSNSGVESPNSNACSYIGGIQFTKVNGVVVKKMGAGEKANVFIGLFATMFVGMAAIVYKLRKNIDAKGSPLLEKDDSQEDKPFA